MMNIRKGGHKDLDKYYSLMEMDFDSEELIPKLSLHKALLNGAAELLVAYDEESQLETGYALVLAKGMYGYVLLKHMGVMPWYRGKGVGVQIMRLVNKRYADRQGILAEITEFGDDDPDHMKKQQRFMARFGYVEVNCDYRISGTKAHLLVKPLKGGPEIERVAHRIIGDIYSRVLPAYKQAQMIDIRPSAPQE